MTVTIRSGGKSFTISNTPSHLGAMSSAVAYSAILSLRLSPMVIQPLRLMLIEELGQSVTRLSETKVLEEVAKRISQGKWTMNVSHELSAPGAHPNDADSQSNKGGGSGSGSGGASGSGGGKQSGAAGGDPLKSTKKTWVEVELVDASNRPIEGVAIEITLPDGNIAKGSLTSKGSFRVDGIDPGTCKVRFPDLDGREWAKSGAFPEGNPVKVFSGAPKIPAGPYTVKQGDHIASIAHDAGFLSWKTIWDDGKNATLKGKRNPNVLNPGDVVEIPAKQKKEESVPTTEYHTFQTTGEPVQLRIVVVDWAGNPLIDSDVVIELSGKETQKTSGDGSVKKSINAGADREGKLSLKGYELPLKVGHLDPVEEISGQVWRLNNLGYRAGEPKDTADMAFKSAVEEFQCDNGLTVDGICGAATQSKLKDVHGS